MRKLVILLSIMLISIIGFTSCAEKNSKSEVFLPVELFPEPAREVGQKDVLELRCDPIETVRIGFIGLGMRGSQAIKRYTNIKGVEIKAICDIVKSNVKKSQKKLEENGFPKADEYTDPTGWQEICKRDDIDLIYICTDWGSHTKMATYAMEQGKHVAVEVPAAITIDECWQLVNTAEKTQRHCMQLENCVYDFFELTTHNMAKQGLFGEVVHVEGAYIHDLRWLNFDDTTGYWNMWRLKENEKRNGNLYPTHGFGPLCHILNIHRGDKMEYVTSLSSNQFGMTEYAIEKFGKDSDFAKREYKNGDMNTSLIKTAKGKSMMIQHDVTSPRPYSRIHLVSGTKGFARKWPEKRIALEPNGHHFLTDEETEKTLKKYQHPITKEIGDVARKVGGHGGMDFIMDYRLIYCLHNGLPLDQDVYDAAEWSALAELSEKSVANNGIPIKVPDFTRGAWNKLKEVTYYHK